MTDWKDEEREVEKADYVEIDDGTYEVTCIGLDREEHTDWQGGTTFLKFTFQLEMFDEQGKYKIQLTAVGTYDRVTPKTKVGQWYSVLTGKKLEPGAKFRASEMLGQQAMALVVNQDRDDGSRWARVDKLIPMPRVAASTKDDKVMGATLERLQDAIDAVLLGPAFDGETGKLANWLVDSGYREGVDVKGDKISIRLQRYSETQAKEIMQALAAIGQAKEVEA